MINLTFYDLLKKRTLRERDDHFKNFKNKKNKKIKKENNLFNMDNII